jgi:hypothetical protein
MTAAPGSWLRRVVAPGEAAPQLGDRWVEDVQLDGGASGAAEGEQPVPLDPRPRAGLHCDPPPL